MSTKKKRDIVPTEQDAKDTQALSRRDFLKRGAAAGIGAAVLAGTTTVVAGSHAAHERIEWDYETDVLVVGAGATGIPAAIRAKDLGADVMIVDQNFDAGGVMLHSAAWVSLGGGDPTQLRDLAGESDPEGFVTVDPVEPPEHITDDVELLFTDMTDWSVVDRSAQAPYRYNERDLHRSWADNAFDTRTFLLDNYVRFSRISGTHGTGGVSRARRAVAILKEGDVTDIRAGTVSTQDAGISNVSTSHFSPSVMGDGSNVAGPDIRHNGAALARPLEYSAREKGIPFMFNRRMVELIREEPFSGRVIGIKATYTPRFDPDTGARLESYWQDGNVDERKETIYIRARQAVVVGTGGHSGNPEFRSMFYPAFRDPFFVTSGEALLGYGRARDGSGIKAAMRIGANLAGMHQNLSYATTFHVQSRIGTRDAYTPMLPGHPAFPFRRSTGFSVGANARQHLITVNQVGKRFFNELDFVRSPGHAQFPGTGHVPNPGVDHVPTDWRNSRVDWIRESFSRHYGMDAALAINEGSEAPDYFPGPVWAIFDAAAVERAGWNIEPPFTSDEDGMFFRADTIEELAQKIHDGCEFQRVPLTHLAETVEKWNAAVDAGVDEEFERGEDAPMFKIMEPPFYAAVNMIVWHDSYGGLRINGKAQVVDLEGEVIPGLYSGGEARGGGNQHGLGRASVHGYIAGTQAVVEPST